MSGVPSSTASMRPSAKPLLEQFSRALTSFQSSEDAFRVLCTLPHRSNGNNGSDGKEETCWGPRRPQRPVKTLVVLDSSFNPPTTAHARMARSALAVDAGEETQQRLMLLLAVNNADKAPKPASFPLRLAMMEAFGRSLLEERVQDDKRGGNGGDGNGLEIDLAVTTMPYFHDKSLAIADSGFYAAPGQGHQQQPTQVFLAGFDTLIRIFNPKYYGGGDGMTSALDPFLTERARLRITTRPDDAWGSREEQAAYVDELGRGKLAEMGGRDEWARRVELVGEGQDVVGQEGGDSGGSGGVSSSRAREMVNAGRLEALDGLVGREVREWIEKEGLYQGSE